MPYYKRRDPLSRQAHREHWRMLAAKNSQKHSKLQEPVLTCCGPGCTRPAQPTLRLDTGVVFCCTTCANNYHALQLKLSGATHV